MATGSWSDSFDSFNESKWGKSNYAPKGNWIDNAWSAGNVKTGGGVLTLELNGNDRGGKPFTGAEVRSDQKMGYGLYEFSAQVSGEKGVASTFFTYTGPGLGDKWNEIDMEFMGNKPGEVSLNYWNGGREMGGKHVKLGFDASKGMHDYAFEWRPDSIKWYAEGRLLHEVKGGNVPIPDANQFVYKSIWTGIDEWLGKPDGNVKAHAKYGDFSFTPLSELDGGARPQAVKPKPDGGKDAKDGKLKLQLVDAETDKVLATLSDGDSIERSLINGRDITFVAKVSGVGKVGSIQFDLDDGARTEVENIAPFAMFGDQGKGEYNGGGLKLSNGAHDLDIIAFAGDDASGQRLDSFDIDFQVLA